MNSATAEIHWQVISSPWEVVTLQKEDKETLLSQSQCKKPRETCNFATVTWDSMRGASEAVRVIPLPFLHVHPSTSLFSRQCNLKKNNEKD